LGIRPGTFCAFELDVAGVVDLTHVPTRADLGVSLEDLLAPWQEIVFVRREQPPTWSLARYLLERGCAGARVPSAVLHGAANIVLWRWNDGARRRVTAHDPLGDLPLNQSAWRQ
jgi:RES domain-containing protein